MAPWADNSVDATALGSGGTSASSKPFIPDIWIDEVVTARENNLVFGGLFWRINHQGKKGDTLHLPTISNPSASDKQESAQVTLVASGETDNVIELDKHKEVSYLFEDMGMAQAKYHIRTRYTKKAGYALAKAIDTHINALAVDISDSSPDHWIDGDGSDFAKGSGGGTAFSKTGFLKAIELLDIQDVPEDDRFLILPPSAKGDLLAIADFTYADRIGRTSEIQKGTFGTIFGIPIYTTNNLYTNNSINMGILAHKEAFICAMQLNVRVQSDYHLDYLADLVVSDCIYGVKMIRDDHAVNIGCI